LELRELVFSKPIGSKDILDRHFRNCIPSLKKNIHLDIRLHPKWAFDYLLSRKPWMSSRIHMKCGSWSNTIMNSVLLWVLRRKDLSYLFLTSRHN
jgi:hypothetical protein